MKKCRITFEFEMKDLWNFSFEEIHQNLFDIFLNRKTDLMMKIIEINPKESKAMKFALERAISQEVYILNEFLRTFQMEIIEEKEK